MTKETTEKIYCLGKINPNHISISDFSEYVNDQPLVLAKGPLPSQFVRKILAGMKQCFKIQRLLPILMHFLLIA